MPSPRRHGNIETPLQGSPRAGASDRLCLLVIGEGFVSTFPLPRAGHLVIGRSEEADISVDVVSVSRRHALLHLDDGIGIEDLGSANGTFIDDLRLERGVRAPLAPGAMFELGTTLFIVQDGHSARRPRRIWTHGYFEARLEEECARAERAGGSFAVVRLRVESAPAHDHALHEIVLGSLRPGDVLATYGPDDYEMLVLDATAGEANGVLDRLVGRLRARRAEVRAAIATYPDHGRVAAALMARACAGIEDPRPASDEAPIVVEADVMKRLHRLVERVAASDINVLVLGETGVGKEVFAERLHALSTRVGGPLLRLNCAALSESLLESELFGHQRGAFTGATSDKAGLLETADGGTVFLDEIGDMPLSLQAKLLRVLEDGVVRRVGGLDERTIDVRVVAATHRDLETEAADGRFRQDLYFRLNGISIVVPPLRERTGEVEALARAFVSAACRRQDRPVCDIDSEAVAALQRYEWPGNIRELRNLMERAVVLCPAGGTITLEHLPADTLAATIELQTITPRPAPADRSPPDLKTGVQQHERQLIIEALARADGNQTRAARMLGISRRTLISRIEDYGLPRPRKRSKR